MVCSEFLTPKYSNFLYIRAFMDIIEQDFSLVKTKRLAVRIIGSREDASNLIIGGPDTMNDLQSGKCYSLVIPSSNSSQSQTRKAL